MLAQKKNRNRIVLIVPVFPQVSETFIAKRFAGLLEKGWDLNVVCDRSLKSDWDFYPHLRARPDIVKRVHISWPHRPRVIEFLLFPIVFLRNILLAPLVVLRYLGPGTKKFGLIRALNNLYLDTTVIALKPDAIHFEFANLAKKRMHLKEFLGCRISASFHGHEVNFVGLDDPEFYSEIWENADAIHFLGKDLLARARNRGFQDQQIHRVIPPGIDSDYFDPDLRIYDRIVGTKDRPLRLLSAARLYWTKGYEYSLQAVRILIDAGIHCEYRIIGDGPHKHAVLFTIDDLRLGEHVKLLYSQSQSEVKAQMKWADVFLHSSVSEGFSYVVLEAQSMALPVVCSNADGLRENVENGVTGFVVDRRDPNALVEKLQLLSGDGELRNRIGEAGRKRVATHFRFRDQMTAWDGFLRSVLCLPAGKDALTVSEHSPAPAVD